MIRGGLYCLFEANRLCATLPAGQQAQSADRQQTHRRRFRDGGDVADKSNVVEHVETSVQAGVIAQEKTELDRLVRESLKRRDAAEVNRCPVVLRECSAVGSRVKKAEQMIAFGEPGLARVDAKQERRRIDFRVIEVETGQVDLLRSGDRDREGDPVCVIDSNLVHIRIHRATVGPPPDLCAVDPKVIRRRVSCFTANARSERAGACG